MTNAAATKIKITGVDIHAYLIHDTKRALEFYKTVLGLTPDAGTESPDGAEFTLADGATFGIWNPQGSMPWHKGTGVMFAVENIESAVEHARANGAKFDDIYESPVCWMSTGEDSEGNQVILHKRKNP